MNINYRIIWNATIGKWVVASELAKGRKKASRTVLAGALVVALAASAPFGVAFAADTVSAETCTTPGGQSGTLNTTGVCTVDTVGGAVMNMSLASNSVNDIGVLAAGVALGTGVATGVDSISLGNSSLVSTASGEASITIGQNLNAQQLWDVAIGADSTVNAGGGVSIGRNINVTGASAVAIGQNSNASAATAVALGANSMADRANTISVGSDVAGSAFTRQIVNVGAGTQANDAVNVSQLSPVVTALGGGASINTTTGAVTGPTYTLANGGTQTTIGGALGALDSSLTTTNTNVTNLDGRVTTNEGSITNLQQQLSDGTVGLVQQNATTGNITVASGIGGSTVDFTGTSGARVLTGVANGVNDTDAVTIAQLKALGVDPEGQLLGALHYDDLTLATATLGGTNGTTINNLAPGLIASGSMQAVNGGQLFDMQQNLQNQFSLLNGQFASLDGRVTTIEQGIADGTIGGGGGVSPGTGSDSTQVGDGAIASGNSSTAVGSGAVASGDSSTATGAGSQATGSNSTATGAGSIASGNNSTANGANSVASGSGSTAVGESASATGTNSTALGSNSSATGNNSVALGAGSVADRDNTVSVGSPGNERQITNVAAGTQRTDAANWGQVQDAVNGVQDWANQKFQQVDKRIDRMGAMSAAYGQMAFSANGLDTKNRMGVGIGAQNGQSALAVGYSRQIRPNMNLSFGGSASAGDVSVGAGLAVGW
ncbi:ESPR-type extended signal peptide-containing protein [Dyella humi]|uniref:YadA-like family protein n=1 Tax=Dyella humi TaxID=1770547 RepID=A0ABW8IJT7_9GAMM